jgi:hypothetical protein
MQEHHDQAVHATKRSESLQSSAEASLVWLTDDDDNRSRQLQTWLELPTAREQRRFLERHCDLLDEQSEMILRHLFTKAPKRSI